MDTGSYPMWEQYRLKREHYIIGLMSGTSLDGTDAALVRILTDDSGGIEKISLMDFVCIPYSNELREVMIRLCSPETARVDDLTKAHFGISEWYAHSVMKLIRSAGIPPGQVDAISMHGQTIWHSPVATAFPGPEGNLEVASTLQIGESAVVRERTGLPVIGNLRARDMAAGGEGAPLTPYADALMFRSSKEGRLVQNIGGIGNVTVLPAASSHEGISAFDTGPGNMVMDAIVRKATNGRQHYDPDGSFAAMGKPDQSLVEMYLEDDYFKRIPPKSTGREVYGAAYAEHLMEMAAARSLSLEDTLATATCLTAETIVRAVEDFVLPNVPISAMLACGGGTSNVTLMKMIQGRLPEGIRLERTTDYGIPDDAREAIGFALLGHEALMGRTNTLPSVTGAKHSVISGALTL
ncbi:anhydro-N-acetylmuramic acid kinase [Paenibacillus xylanilyticus]|uniref:Anhydro-N-acetylmuramic acid kinase n=1 Tax=Paenibacillus xylanilyticus TaxID=248903 RepID=A0A7Y6BWH6_9BACL|nr:anhydro-N-acetylmuramic acid kinase [Paenibacillus xylanilyticus]NUU76214.1 anhydro-N-acetylmuramic acid kinase [Paenibacillus xylanilyticus]